MKGVQYAFDHLGEIQAVIIDVKRHRQLWEDIQDILVVRKRRHEKPIPLDQVKKDLRKKGKLPCPGIMSP
jgi:hypothetical protein